MSHSGANPWLASDAATAPNVRAQELRFAWERFLGEDDEGEELVREPIVASWRRSLAAGVDWTGHRLAPVVTDEEEAHELYEEHPLGRHTALIHACLSAMADEMGYLIVVSDATGVLLSIEGAASVRMRAAGDMNFVEGVLWSEPGAGTNAIGTAIAADHAVQVFGPEHFNEPVQRWTCSAAPIHDPDTGDLLGVIDLTGDYSTVHPHSLAVATATAQAVEATLRLELQDIDARLRERYADRVAAGRSGVVTRALVAPSGRPITALPEGWVPAGHRPGRLAVPPGGGELLLPSGRHAVAEPVGHDLQLYVVRTLETRRRPAPPPGPCSSSTCSAGTARGCGCTAARRSSARAWPRSSRCCARIPRATPPSASARTCTATAAAPGASGSRSAACARSSARGSTWSATGSPATRRPTSAASRACSAPARRARPPSTTAGRCCRPPRRRASCASASASTAGCARR